MVNALVAIIGRQNICQPIIYWRRLKSKVENPISFSYLLSTSVGICKLQSPANYGFNYGIQLFSSDFPKSCQRCMHEFFTFLWIFYTEGIEAQQRIFFIISNIADD